MIEKLRITSLVVGRIMPKGVDEAGIFAPAIARERNERVAGLDANGRRQQFLALFGSSLIVLDPAGEDRLDGNTVSSAQGHVGYVLGVASVSLKASEGSPSREGAAVEVASHQTLLKKEAPLISSGAPRARSAFRSEC